MNNFRRSSSFLLLRKLFHTAACGIVFLAVVPAFVHGDHHGATCQTQFNYWYNIADNNGPPGYPIQTAKEKLLQLASEAGYDNTTTCEMQKNANAFNDYRTKVIVDTRPDELSSIAEAGIKIPGFGFNYADQNASLYGYTIACEATLPDDPKANAATFVAPPSACAYSYPGSNDTTTSPSVYGLPNSTNFDTLASVCRLKIFGFEDDNGKEGLELQWCITDILGTMRIGKAGGYTDDDDPPDISCGVRTIFGQEGSDMYAPISRELAEFPSTFLNGDPITNYSDPDQDPYQSTFIPTRYMVSNVIEGMCNECEKCIDLVSSKFSTTVDDPEDFCFQNGICDSSSSDSGDSNIHSSHDHPSHDTLEPDGIMALACNADDLTSVCNLMKRCEPLTLGENTVFLPTDEAFKRLNNYDTEIACDILAFHVVSGQELDSNDLRSKCGSGDSSLIEMSNGSNARVKCLKGMPYGIKGGGNEEPANFIDIDIQTSDGVVHIIDDVLSYPSLMDGE